MPSVVRSLMRATALLCLALGATGLLGSGPVQAQAGSVHVLQLDGIVNPISTRYVIRGIEEAAEEGAAAVVIEIDTPGGLLEATQDMTSAMLAAQVPVITYVTPAGAQAASAGTFITMAGHVAAMAPSTRMGAATPVSGEGGDIPDDLREKIINDTVEYARIIANARDRNADWAEEAVRDADVVNADEAVEIDAVDLIAPSRGELLEAIDGQTVQLPGREVTLATAGVPVEERDMSPFEDILMALTDPNIALILLSLGTLGIYFELANPGSFFPGIAGAIALILGLFSLGTLPINYAGLALILLGLALMGAEIWVASGGVLGVGGGVAFLLGALILIDDQRAPFLEVSRPLIYGITLGLVLFSIVALRAVMRSRGRPAVIGGSDMVGMEAVVRSPTSVFVEGELWRARAAAGAAGLAAGDRVRVVAREGFELIVAPKGGGDNDEKVEET
jgi:membrane-bound serine protease (ClpP class)